MQVVERQLTAGDDLIGRTQGGFHDSSRIGENIGRSGGGPQEPVHLLVGKGYEIDACLFDHAAQFPRGEHGVNIAAAAVVHFRPLHLELLGGAGHDRYHGDVLRFFADFIRPVGLGDRAEHLLRRFARGKIGQKFGIKIFHVFDPARRAAGELRQGGRLLVADPFGQAFEKLHALFDDGEVGRKIGVEHGAEPEPPQSGDHFSGHERPCRQAEAFAKRRAHGRRGLHDNGFCRIVERFPDAFDVRDFGNGADRADRGALTALHAGDAVESLAERGTDHGLETAELGKERTDRLHLVAGRHATAAFDAFAVITHKCGRAFIDRVRGLDPAIPDGADIEFKGEGLQLAVIVPFAGLAVAVVFGKQELDNRAPRFTHALRVRMHFHSFGGRHDTGGDERLCAFDLHDADAARADRLHVFEIAESGNIDTGLARGVKYGRTFGNGDGNGIDGKGRHHALLSAHTGFP